MKINLIIRQSAFITADISRSALFKLIYRRLDLMIHGSLNQTPFLLFNKRGQFTRISQNYDSLQRENLQSKRSNNAKKDKKRYSLQF